MSISVAILALQAYANAHKFLRLPVFKNFDNFPKFRSRFAATVSHQFQYVLTASGYQSVLNQNSAASVTFSEVIPGNRSALQLAVIMNCKYENISLPANASIRPSRMLYHGTLPRRSSLSRRPCKSDLFFGSKFD